MSKDGGVMSLSNNWEKQSFCGALRTRGVDASFPSLFFSLFLSRERDEGGPRVATRSLHSVVIMVEMGAYRGLSLVIESYRRERMPTSASQSSHVWPWSSVLDRHGQSRQIWSGLVWSLSTCRRADQAIATAARLFSSKIKTKPPAWRHTQIYSTGNWHGSYVYG